MCEQKKKNERTTTQWAWLGGLAAVFFSALLIATSTAPVKAQSLIESYTAQLSAKDFVNSSGDQLLKIEEILQQDRANYHRFKRRDSADEHDRFFSSQSNRSLYPRMVRDGFVEPAVTNQISIEQPIVRVKIYRRTNGKHFVEVSLERNRTEPVEPDIANEDAEQHLEFQPELRDNEETAGKSDTQDFGYYVDVASRIREDLLANDKVLYRKLRPQIEQNIYVDLVLEDGLKRVLKSSVSFTGCTETDRLVVGYYDVVLNNWLLVWLDEARQPYHIWLSKGFLSKAEPLLAAGWYEALEKEGSFSSALRRSFSVQANVFSQFFPPQNCVNLAELEHYFSPDQAAYDLIDVEQVIRKVQADNLEAINQHTTTRLKLGDDRKLILTLAQPDVFGADLLTIHTINTSTVTKIVQLWRTKDHKPTLLNEVTIPLATLE